MAPAIYMGIDMAMKLYLCMCIDLFSNMRTIFLMNVRYISG